MKKLLLLLFLIPHLVMGENSVCAFIVRSEEDFYKSKGRIPEKCSTKEILRYTVIKKGINLYRVDEFVMTVKSIFCDYDKQISSFNNERSHRFTCQVK